jgi:hypothetical protein
MDLKATIDIIIKDLNDIREIVDDLKQYQGVPAIEIELAKSKCRSVIEIISFLRNNDLFPVAPKQDRPEVKEESPAVKLEASAGKEEISTVKEEYAARKEESVVIKEEFTIIADQFANRPESFNEKLGSMKHDDDVLELIKTKPVSTLSEAIGINDKYLFIKEIFNGDQESYHQVLSKLETAGCLDDAKAILMTWAGEKRENEAFKMFISILKRKFPSNE